MVRQITAGFSAYGKALGIIFSQGLWWFFLFPFILNAVLLMAGFSFASALAEPAREWILEATGLDSSGFFLSEYLRGFILVLVIIILKILFFFLFAMLGGYITLILLSPVLAYLSERTERILTGRSYPFNPVQFVRDLVRSFILSLRNMFFQMAAAILLFITGFIPVIGLASPFLLFAVSAHFYGFSFMDYSLERKKFSMEKSVHFVNSNKGLAFAIGSPYLFLLLVPYVGVFLAGFGAIVSTVAATITAEETVSA